MQAMRDGVQEVAVKVLAASQFSGIAEGIQLQVLKKVCLACSASPLCNQAITPLACSLFCFMEVAPCILLQPFRSRVMSPHQKLFSQLHIREQHLHCSMFSGSAMVHMSALACLTAGQTWTLSLQQQSGMLSLKCTLVLVAASL